VLIIPCAWGFQPTGYNHHQLYINQPSGVVLGLPSEGPAAYQGGFGGEVLVAAVAACVAAVYEGLVIKSLATRRVAWSLRRRALVANADGQVRHQCLTDDALDEAKATAQTGQYPRWKRRVIGGWLLGGPVLDTKRRARTRAWTARLSMLTHFAPPFGPEMGRSDHVWLFGSGRWGGFSPFFCPRGHVRTRGG
jgi:hypothetical protein